MIDHGFQGKHRPAALTRFKLVAEGTGGHTADAFQHEKMAWLVFDHFIGRFKPSSQKS